MWEVGDSTSDHVLLTLSWPVSLITKHDAQVVECQTEEQKICLFYIFVAVARGLNWVSLASHYSSGGSITM